MPDPLQDEPGVLDPHHPVRRAWREEGARLEAEARDMLGPENVLAPYLEAQPGVRKAIRQAAQEVRDALQHERYRAFGWLTEEVVRQVRETRTEAFHVPRYGETIALAKALSEWAALPPRTRELVDSWLAYHARCEPLCRQIRDWPARADALTADCPERPATLDALTGWRQRAEPLLAGARAMLAEDSPHGSHLAAMPDEHKALVEGTSSLERELIAVKARETELLTARETKLLTANVQRSSDELHRDWEAHVAKATAARVDPFYFSGHEGLIDRLQELRQHPAVEELPERERNRIDSVLNQYTRRTETVSHVDNHLAEVQRCGRHLEQLKDLANAHKLELEEVPSYDEWHDTAERLLAAGKAIADDRKTYGPCLNHHPGAWSGVHASIRELAAALGRDTTSLHHRQSELYLEPITRPVPDSQQARDADASYRLLRDQWHKHLALAEDTQAHPYQLPSYAPLIDTMVKLRDQPLLAAAARGALDALLTNHADIHQRAPADIDDYLKKTAQAFQTLNNLEDVAQQFSSLNVTLEDMSVYADWKKRASDLAEAGEAMLADRDRYGIHLQEHPETTRRIETEVQRLNAALGRDDASIRRERRQSLSEDEKTAEHRSQRRGIKL